MLPYLRSLLIGFSVVVIGVVGGYLASAYTKEAPLLSPVGLPFNQFPRHQIIGFLPYWLLSAAKDDYSPYLTTLTYFGVTVGNDGHLVQKTNRTESEPGWYTLTSGKADRFFQKAKEKKLTLSLLVFAAQDAGIYALISDPKPHAQNLVNDVLPIMRQYNFSDLNLDIESLSSASDSARQQFTAFTQNVNQYLKQAGRYTLTIEVTASDAIKHKLIDVQSLNTIADHVVVMAYDYHHIGSQVTGPIAPLSGGNDTYEYDVTTAIDQVLNYLPAKKVILGIPSYGYEWETLSNATASAVLPGSGLTATAKRVQTILNECTACQQINDSVTQETFLTYPDQKTNTIHQIYVPNQQSTQSKIDLAKEKKLGGLAVWALGYENDTLLEPLKKYKP